MKIPKIIKDASMLVILMLAIGFLFTLQGLLEQTDYTEITGDVIQVGRGQNQNTVVVGNGEPKVPPKLPPKTPEEIANSNLKCWVKAGVTTEDLVIVGSLLRTTKCKEPTQKKEIKSSVENNCLKFNVEEQAYTDICVKKEETPDFNIALPTQGKGSVDVPSVKRSIWPIILFLLILFFTFGVWSWDEMRGTFKGSDFKRYDELELFYGAHKLPTYGKTLSFEERESAVSGKMDEIYTKLLREKEKRAVTKRLSQKEAEKMINKFNQLSQELYEDIKRNDIPHSIRHYNHLFDTFLQLYPSVHKANQQTLLKVVIYFGKQLALLQKSRKISHLIKEAYADTDKHKVAPRQTDQPGIMVPQDLETSMESLKQLLKEAKDEKALKKYKKLFTTLK